MFQIFNSEINPEIQFLHPKTFKMLKLIHNSTQAQFIVIQNPLIVLKFKIKEKRSISNGIGVVPFLDVLVGNISQTRFEHRHSVPRRLLADVTWSQTQESISDIAKVTNTHKLRVTVWSCYQTEKKFHLMILTSERCNGTTLHPSGLAMQHMHIRQLLSEPYQFYL